MLWITAQLKKGSALPILHRSVVSYADILGALSSIPRLCSRLTLAGSGEPFKPHARPINDCFCHEIPLSLRKYKQISHGNKTNVSNLPRREDTIFAYRKGYVTVVR